MPDAIKTLQALQAHEREMIEELVAVIESKQRQLNDHQARLGALTDAIKSVSAQPGATPEPVPAKHQRYTSISLTDAVKDVIERNGAGQGLFIKEIMEQLALGGYTTESPNLYASAYSVAMRLVKRGKVTVGKRDGQRSFIRATPF